MKKVSLQKYKGKAAYEDFSSQLSQSGEPWCMGRPLAQKTNVKSEKSSSISLFLYKSMARTKHFAKRSRGGSNPSNAAASPSQASRTSARNPSPGSGAGHKQKKPHRFRPGTVALQEIRKFQKSSNLLIPAAPFIRTVKEISNFCALEVTRWAAEALLALQEAAEDFFFLLV